MGSWVKAGLQYRRIVGRRYYFEQDVLDFVESHPELSYQPAKKLDESEDKSEDNFEEN